MYAARGDEKLGTIRDENFIYRVRGFSGQMN